MFSSIEDRRKKFENMTVGPTPSSFASSLVRGIDKFSKFSSYNSINVVGRFTAWIASGILADILMIYKIAYIYPERVLLLAAVLAVILYFTWPVVVVGFIGVMMSPTVNLAAAQTLCCLTYFFGGLFSLGVVGNLTRVVNLMLKKSTHDDASKVANSEASINDNSDIIKRKKSVSSQEGQEVDDASTVADSEASINDNSDIIKRKKSVSSQEGQEVQEDQEDDNSSISSYGSNYSKFSI